jgi:hypothetical protein
MIEKKLSGNHLIFASYEEKQLSGGNVEYSRVFISPGTPLVPLVPLVTLLFPFWLVFLLLFILCK